MPRGRAALLYLALLAGLAWAPSRAGAQWGFPVAVPQVAVPGVWDWTQAVDWYWDSLLGGLETWRPEAAHGPSHEERRPVGGRLDLDSEGTATAATAPPAELEQVEEAEVVAGNPSEAATSTGNAVGEGSGMMPPPPPPKDAADSEGTATAATAPPAELEQVEEAEVVAGNPSEAATSTGNAVGEGSGMMPPPPLPEDAAEMLKRARLHVFGLLLNLTSSAVDELGGGANAQAVAYDYDDEEGSEYDDDDGEGFDSIGLRPLESSEILSKVYDKIKNRTGVKEFSGDFSDLDVEGESIRLVRAIDRLPEEVRRVIERLNETLAGAILPPAASAEGEEGPRTSVGGWGIDGQDQELCAVQDLVTEEEGCLGADPGKDADVCFVSIIREALRRSQYWRQTVEASSFSVVFLPSDSALLRLLKFAQVSPRDLLKGERMREVINRHSVVFNDRDIADDPFGRTGIGRLLEADFGGRFAVMELPSGGGTNAGNVTFLMDRTEGRSSPGGGGQASSLYIATKRPECQMREMVGAGDGTVSRFYVPEEDSCLANYLEFCLNPTYDQAGPLGEGEVTENPCGIAQLLGVRLCSDGIVLPINDLLFDSEQAANFLALLTGATDVGKGAGARAVYDWPLTSPAALSNEGSGGEGGVAAVVGSYDAREDFTPEGFHLDGSNFVFAPGVSLRGGNGTTICFRARPGTSRPHTILLAGRSGRSNFTATAWVEDQNLMRLRLTVGDRSYTSSLVLQEAVGNNVAVVVDEGRGLWSFYENGWLVDRAESMPGIPSFEGELTVGGAWPWWFPNQEQNFEGTLGGVKIFEQVLSPEEIARSCEGGAPHDKEGAEEGLAARDEPGGENSTCPGVAEHIAAVSPPPASGAEPKVAVRKAMPAATPQYLYPLTYNGTNAGTYGPSSPAEGRGNLTSSSFTRSGVHLDGKTEYLMIDGVALEGKNFTLGFHFSLDTDSRVHQNLFQLISECRDDPVNLYVQLKVHSEITGVDKDVLKVVLNQDAVQVEVDRLATRRPKGVVVLFEGERVRVYLSREGEGGEAVVAVGTGRVTAPLPAVLGKARLGSPNSFAGVVKDLFLYDGALAENDIVRYLKSL